MTTYIVLFRAINVGGKNRVIMKDLVAVLESMGYEQVKTYIQSGNVIFQDKEQETDLIASAIRSRVLEEWGFEPKVMVLTKAELQDIVDNNPFDSKGGKDFHLYFLEMPPKNPDLEALHKVQSKSEEFRLCGKVFYLYAPEGIGRSKLAAKIEKSLGVPVTARNGNTVRKLITMV